jgi:hypothetical protein
MSESQVHILTTQGKHRVRHLTIWAANGYAMERLGPLCRNPGGNWKLWYPSDEQPQIPYCTRCVAEVQRMAWAITDYGGAR